MGDQPNPYASPGAKVDDGPPTTAELRKRFRRRIIWGLTILGAASGVYSIYFGIDAKWAGAAQHSAFVKFSLMFAPVAMALEGALAGWLLSGVLWHLYRLLKKP